MVNCDDIDELDEGDSTYATTTTTEDIQYIETTIEWSNWCNELAETKEEEGIIVECVNGFGSHGGWKSDNDRMIGRFAETFTDVGSNEPYRYEGFDMPEGNKKFPSVARSSESKRKRGSQREVDVEGIHLAFDCTNDQLKTIAEWPARVLANDNHVRTEFFRILREISKLTSLDRGYCKGIFCLVWTTCRVLYSCLRMRGRAFVESSYET
ncbi:retrotransposon protein [Cucumis melo var. makuwa]|uniref:Retrotransposon protein n=1 Tax=Cucumis melo var. makuwa TaxID=1194695 RepID=A0A5D3DX58_CUCMM|nr:retrotransposon protein [Cucumis melo var. makuwa]TYK28336.1 retrotransposon protein [Cucumis melo var. makuwa]